MRSLLAVAIVAVVSGCASRIPTVVHYDLMGPAAAQVRPEAGAPAIALERFTAAAPYDSDRIALRSSQVRLEYYRYHQWVSPAPELITELFADRWRASGRFSRVEIDSFASDVPLTVSGRVQTLELDARSRPPVARVAIEVTARAADGAVVYHRLLTRSIPIANRSHQAIVAALRQGVEAIARDTAPAIEAAGKRQIEAR